MNCQLFNFYIQVNDEHTFVQDLWHCTDQHSVGNLQIRFILPLLVISSQPRLAALHDESSREKQFVKVPSAVIQHPTTVLMVFFMNYQQLTRKLTIHLPLHNGSFGIHLGHLHGTNEFFKFCVNRKSLQPQVVVVSGSSTSTPASTEDMTVSQGLVQDGESMIFL